MRPGTLPYQKLVLIIALGDLMASLVAYGGAFVLRIYVPIPFTADMLPFERFFQVNHYFFPLLLSQVGFLYFFQFYDLATLRRRRETMVTLPVACALQTIFIVSVYFFRGDPVFPRSVLFIYWLLNTILLAVSRAAIFRRAFGQTPRRMVLIGSAAEVAGLAEELQAIARSSQYEIRGWIATDEKLGNATAPLPCLGNLADVLDGRVAIDADEVVVISEETRKDRLVDILNRAQSNNRYVSVLPSRYEIVVGGLGSLRLGDIPLTELTKRPEEDLRFILKGVLDRVLALLLLLLLSPLLAVVGLLIKVTSGRPVVYTQVRVGKRRRPFTMYKFRTMSVDAERDGGARLASDRDARVTAVGRWLRSSRIDELPQLFNVLNGTMSLVGPRPERPEFVERFLKEISGYDERFLVKPGLTGLAQVHGEYHTASSHKLKYDIAYIYHYSMWLDVKILLETVRVILTGGGT